MIYKKIDENMTKFSINPKLSCIELKFYLNYFN